MFLIGCARGGGVVGCWGVRNVGRDDENLGAFVARRRPSGRLLSKSIQTTARGQTQRTDRPVNNRRRRTMMPTVTAMET
jgi:hypothetical protein